MKRQVAFTSEDATLRGELYVPDGGGPFPAVVMAHGFSATAAMTADKYAEVFCAAGLAVLLYDHFGFGQSGGEPRRHINPWLQARGYRDALGAAIASPEVDPRRVAIWGDSLSGGVALAVAALDDRVAALSVQVPAIGATPPPADPGGALFRSFAEFLAAGRVMPGPDELDGPMPVVSDDQEKQPSALLPLTAYRWFTEYGGRPGSGWVNEVTRVRLKDAPAWQPGLCAPRVTCPAIFVVSPHDEMRTAVPAVSRAAYEALAGPREWVDVPGGHFGLLYWPSPEFDLAAHAQATFLTRHLG